MNRFVVLPMTGKLTLIVLQTPLLIGAGVSSSVELDLKEVALNVCSYASLVIDRPGTKMTPTVLKSVRGIKTDLGTEGRINLQGARITARWIDIYGTVLGHIY
ncbi:hypothetical protein F5Y03DRAFT_347043 [Xylaria venustula]|nr:hypothetical protein F5Y03DRAFT_347043 [Xylaria venustula]